ncbi:MAG: TRAP transporter large permease subunit [Betaproteobacteria bacterium]|nr:TRAP transporter large permease subunit [Betaproteobacteria bacterium]
MEMQSFAPMMFVGLILVLLIGFPVAFSLSALGLACGFFAVEMGWFKPEFMSALPLNVFGILSNDLLLAIPFFTMMGTILEKCGLAEDMLDSMGQLFGPMKGGLGYSVIIVGFILGAITGTVAGQVIAMAMISLPVMMRYGYNMRYATGVLAASGTITQLVPPSLVLVVMADQLGKSVGDMYKGAWGPSILQVLIFALYTFLLTRVRPDWVPGVPKEARTMSGTQLWLKCLRGIIPSAVLIFAQTGFLIVVNIFIFFLAFFLDFFEIAFIILPLLGPVADKLGIDLIWFGVLLCVNMQTSFMHPPFGFALFYLRGISDSLFKNGSLPRKVESNDIYLGAIPWVVMQLILVVIVIFVPETVTTFLDKKVEVDMNQATEQLMQMGGGREEETKDQKEEDPMAVFRK